MTAQIHERLIFNGEETSMIFCPPLPERHPRIIKLDEDDVEGRFSTACRRKYIGTWEIKDNQFYLVDITGSYQVSDKNPIFADWFSGVIRIPKGDFLEYIHIGFASVYEQEIHVKIENGKVIKSNIIDNRTKDFDTTELGLKNLPGYENFFDGDDAI